jgi:hypothetical protein
MKIFFILPAIFLTMGLTKKLGFKNFLLDNLLFYTHSISNSQTEKTKVA